MAKTSQGQSIKTIEDLIRAQMIEKEAIVRLLIKKKIITPDELKDELDGLMRELKNKAR